MKRRANIKTELKLLSLLATHKEYEQYKMQKATNISYRTILRHLKPLEERGFIRLTRTEPSEKGGKDKKIYAITLKGLYLVMFNNRDERDILERIINEFPNMLLAFKKWPLFVEAGLKEIMLSVLRDTLHVAFLFDVTAIAMGLKVKFAAGETFRQSLNASILYAPLFGVHPPVHEQATVETLMTVYGRDEELSRFIDSCFRRDQKRHEDTLKVKKLWDTFKVVDNL